MTTLRFTETVTRVRIASGARGSDGRYVNGAETQTTGLLVDIQPLTGREQQTLPEGERERNVQKMYAEVGVFRDVSQHDDTPADQVIWDGVRYEVRRVEDRTRLLVHQKCHIIRLQETA